MTELDPESSDDDPHPGRPKPADTKRERTTALPQSALPKSALPRSAVISLGSPALFLSCLPIADAAQTNFGDVGALLGPVAPFDGSLPGGWLLGIGLGLTFLAGLLSAALLKFSPAKLENKLEKDLVRKGKSREWLEQLSQELDEARRYVPAASLLKLVGLGIALIGAEVLVTQDATFWPRGPASLAVLFVLAGLFSEILPDRITDLRAESVVRHGLPLLRSLRYVLLVVTWPLSRVARFVVRNVLGIRAEFEAAKDRDELADEILAAVEDSDELETLDKEEKEWIENIVEFRDQDVVGVMTPRTDIVAVEASTSFREAVEVGVKAGHARLPVYEGTLDQITGIFYLRDAVAHIADDDQSQLLASRVSDHTRPPYFVPESKRVGNLLKEFRDKRLHMAIVIDEYGGTSGIVSLEDILEEIVGEIEDEYDSERENPLVILEQGRLAEIDARVKIDDVNEALGIELPESEDYETVGGFVFSQLGHIPKASESVTFESVELTVQSASERRIERIRVRVLADETAGAG